jgi:Arc/MetJ family transcription regulator
MLKTELARLIDDLTREAVRRYRLSCEQEAVYLALRNLLGDEEHIPADAEFDVLSDMSALRRNGDTG